MKRVVYYWYDQMHLRFNGDAMRVEKAIRAHDLKAFNAIKDKYQPNKEGMCYFPGTAYVYEDGNDESSGEIDITTPEGFAQITESTFECG